VTKLRHIALGTHDTAGRAAPPRLRLCRSCNSSTLTIGQSDTTASLWRQFVWLVLIEERPNMVLDERTKELAQADVLQGEVQEEAADHGPCMAPS
jgi:hypothetical protein